MSIRLLFAAGGTGGHIFPATAVADCCRRLHADVDIEFVGTRGKLEERVVPRAGYPLNYLWISGFERRFSLSNALLPAKMVTSYMQARRLLARFKPHVVICAGAYVSLPVGFAAAGRRIPLVLMESNAFPGLAVRRLASRATEIHVAFDEATKHLPASKVIVSGNPVREVFSKQIDREEASRHFGLRSDLPTLFAFGGSLGAQSINSALDRVHKELRREGVQIIWQTGRSYSGAEMQDKGLYRTTFLNEMELAYAASDMVLARAGATTIAELKAVGKPSILVPLPIVAVRQLDNAIAMQKVGAAEMIRDENLDRELLPRLRELFADRVRLEKMTENVASMAVTDADEQIARHVLKLAGVS